MQAQRSFLDDLKHQFRHGGMTMKLLFINLGVFLLIGIASVIIDLQKVWLPLAGRDIVGWYVGLDSTLSGFLHHPWGIFTYMFVHFDFLHIAMNMLFFYMAGRMFEQLFGSKKLLYVYLIGGLTGGILEIIAHETIPMFEGVQISVVGASGSVMAVFMTIAFHRPNTQVFFFGVFPIRIIWLAALFIFSDLLGISKSDSIAHFAHLGGALTGFLAAQKVTSPNNILNMAQRFVNWIQGLFKRKPKLTKVNPAGGSWKTDEEYNMEAKARQAQIDLILDKISKSGYESLTKKEKDFLFNQSKR